MAYTDDEARRLFEDMTGRRSAPETVDFATVFKMRFPNLAEAAKDSICKMPPPTLMDLRTVADSLDLDEV